MAGWISPVEPGGTTSQRTRYWAAQNVSLCFQGQRPDYLFSPAHRAGRPNSNARGWSSCAGWISARCACTNLLLVILISMRLWGLKVYFWTSARCACTMSRLTFLKTHVSRLTDTCS